MDSNPYSPQTTADVPLKNKGPLAAAAIVGMWFAALLALVYLTIVGMAVSECLKSPPSGISGYVQTGALSALFATICLISIVQLKARRPGAYWWLLFSPTLVVMWIGLSWLTTWLRP